LYVNLRGFDSSGSPLDSATVIRDFLGALGLSPQQCPADPDALAALYRSELAGRRMLIVLDNARDSGQVRPLLPGVSGCLVLVTSRSHLSGLVTSHGAHVISLALLSTGQAQELLARRLGPDRVRAEAAAVEEIISGCARLPLALSIAAAHATSHPHLPLRALADGLRQAGDRLNVLTTDDGATDARAVFSWSYRALSPGAARLFRLLGLHPGPDWAAPAAASLAALDPQRTRTLLAELARANLIMEHAAGRYTFHDLLRAYAIEQVNAVDSDDQRHAAVHRILDHYLHTGCAAVRLLDADHSGPEVLDPHPIGVVPQRLTDQQQALAWFSAERGVLRAAVHLAADTGFDVHVWRLAAVSVPFLFRQGYWDQEIETQLAAVAAADRLADRLAKARAQSNLANAYIRQGRFDDARTLYRHSLDIATEVGALPGQAILHANLSHLSRVQGHHAEALDHAQQAANLFEAADDHQGKGRVLSSIGVAHAGLGDRQAAMDICHQALALQLELDDRLGLATTWYDLGCIQHRFGEYVQAVDSYERALRLERELGALYNEAETLTGLGNSRRAAGDARAARRAWRQALVILDRLRHPDAADVRAALATVAAELDGLAEGRVHAAD
jgi:tetratricopeptide (TPR) repeat protein